MPDSEVRFVVIARAVHPQGKRQWVGGHSGGVSVKGSPLFGRMVYTANPNADLPMEMMVSEEASKI